MNAERRAAIAAGSLFLIATPASLTAAALLPATSGSDWFPHFGDQPHTVVASALLYLVAAGCSGAIALALYPVVRTVSTALGVGSVVFRAIEAAFYAVEVVPLLTVLTLTERLDEASTAEVTSYGVQAEGLVSAREHAAAIGVLAFTAGAFMYYLAMYEGRLLPRWLTGWGMAGAVAMALGAILAVVAVVADKPVTSYVPLAAPIGVQEMVFAVWLLIRGFQDTPRPPASTIGAGAEPGQDRRRHGRQTVEGEQPPGTLHPASIGLHSQGRRWTR